MPAAPAASFTPATGARLGTVFGASGDTPPDSPPMRKLLFLGFVVGRSGRGQILDLRFGMDFLDHRFARVLRELRFDLFLDRVERRRLPLALILDLDDVPAELRLHRLGDFSLRERES